MQEEGEEDRRREADMIRKFHPDKIPILLNRNRNSKLKQFDNNKYKSHKLESSSWSPLQYSNLSWSSRRNCKSITRKPSTYSQVIHSSKPTKHYRVFMKSMLTLINFSTSPIVSTPLLGNESHFDNLCHVIIPQYSLRF